LNCTPTTPTLSEALAATLADPETVAPAAGLEKPTLGALVSPVPPGLVPDTVTETDELDELLAASRATAVSVWPPLVAVLAFQLTA
jgi:hypothetical protein